MSGRARSQSISATANSKAQLITAYNELGKELSDTKMRVVGNYNIGRAIGEGSYGKVRLGTHRLTASRVALKQIPKSVSAQLTREIHHHRQLHHPHIAQLYEVIATESSIWLVTELCAGGELFDYLVEKGRIDEYEARVLFGQLCLAVAYCHEQGVVHRDLKLENVLLDDHCRVKLSDFGFTREYDRGSLLDTFCGTTGYASPEMLMGQKYLGQEVDIWSLGVILYALLTGALPFDDDDEHAMKEKVMLGEFEDPEWLSTEARDLIKSILVMDPSKRPSIPKILSHPWFTLRIYPNSPPADWSAAMPPSFSEMETELARPSSSTPESTPFSSTTLFPAGSTTRKEASTTDDVSQNTKPTELERPNSRPLNERKLSSSSIAPPLPSRTPARTKRRSVASTISPPSSPKQRPASIINGIAEPVDFAGAISQQTAVVFSTKQEREMLSALAALGFDTAQIVHSVLSNACDSAGAIWWILRRKYANNLTQGLTGTSLTFGDDSTKNTLSNAISQDQDVSIDEESNTAIINDISQPVLLGDIDEAKKKKRDRRPGNVDPLRFHEPSIHKALPDLTLVPATPIVAEEPSGKTGTTNPVAILSMGYINSISPSSSPPSGSSILHPIAASQKNPAKPRSGSVSMLQRATTVLGGAAGLVKKKSEEVSLATAASSIASVREKEREKSTDEPRTSNGSGGKLTKSPPPGKISREAKERENSGEISVGSWAPSQIDQNSPPSSQPTLQRARTEMDGVSSSVSSGGANKSRTRASFLNTFRMWFDDGRRKRKAGSTSGMSNISSSMLAGSSSTPLINSSTPPMPTRKRSSIGKPKPRRNSRYLKDKRPSISSRRSSSVNSRRSSVASMASLGAQAALGSVGEYTVFTGGGLTRNMSDASRRSYGGIRTPIEEDAVLSSRPGSARSTSANGAGLAQPGTKHSKSSSTSSTGSLSRTKGDGLTRPGSATGNVTPSQISRPHRRGGSGSSQTRVVKQQRRPGSAGKGNSGKKHGRSGSISSVHSEGSSRLDEEFGVEVNSRSGSPFGIPGRPVLLAQKKGSAYGAPGGVPISNLGRSSWKKSWGKEPPGWATRASNQSVVVEVLDSRGGSKGNVRDVFATGGKNPGGHALLDDDDDWIDEDDEVHFAGGLGQPSGSSPGNGLGLGAKPPDSPLMIFSHSNAGRRSKRVVVPGLSQLGGNHSKPGGSPAIASSPLPVTPTTPGSSGLSNEVERGGRRQLPNGRAGFRGPAIVEEEEEEEE